MTRLSPREEEIAYLLVGNTYQDIGDILGVSERTVRYHVRNMGHKYGLKGRMNRNALIRALKKDGAIE